ncbi:hypothetical protein, partial [Rufibacter sediminis]|uniref:hypothetical protein n=1 Tax=Rufibacter sediminis TaxID=2762756 RepID=UPI0019D50D22
ERHQEQDRQPHVRRHRAEHALRVPAELSGLIGRDSWKNYALFVAFTIEHNVVRRFSFKVRS